MIIHFLCPQFRKVERQITHSEIQIYIEMCEIGEETPNASNPLSRIRVSSYIPVHWYENISQDIEIPAAEIPASSYPLKCQLQTDRRPVLTQ